ncbi:MAG: FtsX-like permease family protein [Rhodospirillaceae bacterium]|nr:FtsX-like permease family protein [Rhodospirillaceae bacterium]
MAQSSSGTSSIAMRFALRELRGGIKGFRIFLACLALGVAAIAGAGSLNDAVQAGIEADAQPLLGGDLQARHETRTLNDAELNALKAAGAVSYQLQLRSMARVEKKSVEDAAGTVQQRALVEVKAVDDVYPLYGALITTPADSLNELLGQKNDRWGTVIDEALAQRLNIAVGAIINVGDAALEVRALITKEPDRVVTFMTAGPRVMISTKAIPATGLVQPGSLVTHVYNIKLDGGKVQSSTVKALREKLTADFPDAGWRLRGTNQAAQGVEAFLDNVTLFLTLVGMTALLTGGIGVANAVRAYMAGRINTIATLKCLGAPAETIFRIYTIQITILSAVGIAMGLVVGAIIPLIAGRALEGLLPVSAEFGIYPSSLLKAFVFGILTAAVFALWPLARARDIPPVALFRNLLAPARAWPRRRYMAILAVLSAALAAYTIGTAEQPRYATFFVVGTTLALILFAGAAKVVMGFARKLSSGRNSAVAGKPTLRLALSNLYRPGAPTTSVVLSLGLGLSVLVSIALVQTNLDARLAEGVPKDAPSMFFIDIQNTQVDDFKAAVESVPGVHNITTAAMIRGRISKINGVDVDKADIEADSRWAIRGERGVSYAGALPANAKLVQGAWWPEDYAGENLVSLDERVAKGMKLKLGDSISLNILGREITAKLANTRDIRWQSGTMNFTLIYSPGALMGAPGMHIATVDSDAGTEAKIENAVLEKMPNVTVIQVRDAVQMIKDVLDSLSVAVRITAAVALVAGALVLAGAIAAGHARRIYESVVLKVLGATRRNVLSAFVFEYCLLGLATGGIAVGVGALASWAVVVHIMKLEWQMGYGLAVGVVTVCIAVTLMAGFAGTWRALGIKAAPLLRND